jgi:uncharacterized ion transporter superfamily protein YfcC
MVQNTATKISRKSFFQSFAILFLFMLVAGLLTRIIQPGVYERTLVQGREVIDPDSYRLIDRPDYPAWRWLTAPVEVLWGTDSLMIITIIVFLIMVGVAFSVLERSGILKTTLDEVVKKFGSQKYILLLIISFMFMAVGAFLGIFEEVVPLVPLMIVLAHSLGWDTLVGLGMSILATNMGFSAAITNPFTIGVAQKLAGLPLFSGAEFRISIFLAIYIAFAIFLTRYARQVEKDKASLPTTNNRTDHFSDLDSTIPNPALHRAGIWMGIFVMLIAIVLVSGPLIPSITDYALPLVGVLFLIAGLGAGLISGQPPRIVWRSCLQGAMGIAPAIPLILMASSVKYIVAQGAIIDSILNSAASFFAGANLLVAAILIYFLTLAIEFFIPSGSAKAFLLIPLIIPLADLVGITRQLTVTAYCFGDGFSNLAYPTNPVLLISLGLGEVSYLKWLRWTAKLWGWLFIISVVFLYIGIAIGYGPF